jgi:hypothetical protein
MQKFTCSLVAGGEDFFFVTLIAETRTEARKLAVAETQQGTPRDWTVSVLEENVDGPARVLDSGTREA